jgi:hypothetical protein
MRNSATLLRKRLAGVVFAMCGLGALADGEAAPPATTVPAVGAEAPMPANPLLAMPAIPKGMARLVVIRPSSFRSALVNARIRVEGETVGWVKNGHVAVADVASGSIEVQIDNPLNFGHTSVPIVVAEGQTQYMLLKPTIVYLGVIGQIDYGEMKKEHQLCDGDWCVDLLSPDDGLVVAGTLPVTGPQSAKEAK